jgi:hypothetical protein
MIWIYLCCIAVVAWWAWGEYMPKIREAMPKKQPLPKWDDTNQMPDNCRCRVYGPIGDAIDGHGVRVRLEVSGDDPLSTP